MAKKKTAKQETEIDFVTGEEIIVEPQAGGMEFIEDEDGTPQASQELATVGPTDLEGSTPLFGNSVPDAEDIAFPFIRLAQALTHDVQHGTATAGQWIGANGDATDDLVVVPLMFSKRREYRDPDTRGVECTSYDGNVGRGTPGGDCSQCPLNQWGDNGKPPACTFMYSYLVFDLESEELGMINFKRSGITAGKRLNTLVALNGIRNFGVRLTSSTKTGNMGSYYVPQVTKTALDAETLQKANEAI